MTPIGSDTAHCQNWPQADIGPRGAAALGTRQSGASAEPGANAESGASEEPDPTETLAPKDISFRPTVRKVLKGTWEGPDSLELRYKISADDNAPMPAHAALTIPWEDEDYCTGKFDPITYGPDDIGGTRVYEIAEQPCHEAGTSTLCGTSCTLKVTIINDDGQIRAESEHERRTFGQRMEGLRHVRERGGFIGTPEAAEGGRT